MEKNKKETDKFSETLNNFVRLISKGYYSEPVQGSVDHLDPDDENDHTKKESTSDNDHTEKELEEVLPADKSKSKVKKKLK